MKPLRLALLPYPVGRPEGVPAFAAKLDRLLAEAREGGAELAVLPEYASVELGASLCRAAPPTEAAELAAMVEAAPAILDSMRAAAMRAGLWLQPGSLAMRDADGLIRNRAPLIAPDGRMAFQDKQNMTRFEKERWGVSAGAAPAVFETPWGRIGISICYDVEFPLHVRAQVEAGAWLILAPSCTDTLHGFNRVRLTAAARAVENQCFVAVTPTVGEAPWSAALDVNRGKAAIFGPVDRGFPDDGVIAEGVLDEPRWLFADLDPARITAVRREGAVFNHQGWLGAVAPASVAGFA
ncbi:carbon-nitrogen hydrolase family protein [Roseomonas sp. SSH11]|uniref:Carbon-nitrogen hydrolase family protein n=1 Tax=Pararoseomonas baculiformis TaxID=2820812 RepID=A0ABS4AF24_9PROT|nr:carbon-nitrogen hydrolase family protein [Pararoseomonas baculiformis]MBP0445642.1 carbon-nitrogen hydrolase family protein [Pararoseomonas baculiformis]